MLWPVSLCRSFRAGGNGVSSGKHCGPISTFGPDDNRALIGGEDDDFRSPIRRDRRVNSKTDRLASRFGKMFPAIEVEVAFRWAGTFGETKDGLPYIGQIRQMPHCHFALGFGGNGIIYSIIAAEIIRDALLQRPNRNARLFGFDR
jgi:glycine/D-amino acid oxidase-like deaminating enzyme